MLFLAFIGVLSSDFGFYYQITTTGASIISQLFSKCWLVCFLLLSFLLAQTYSYTTDVNQSLKNRTRFTSYMRGIYADLRRESVSYRKVATGLQLKVWWCTSEARKYKKRSRNAVSDNVLLHCNIAWKKQTADLALVASRFSHAL